MSGQNPVSRNSSEKKPVGKSLVSGWGVFIGFAAGGVIGLIFNRLKEDAFFGPLTAWISNNVFLPIGNAFLLTLFMIVVPLVFSSLLVGIARLGGGKGLGKMGLKLFLFYSCSTILAVTTGQTLVNTMKPGAMSEEQKESALLTAQGMEGMGDRLSALQTKSSMVEGASVWPDIVSQIIPKNIIQQFGETNMLAVIFVSLLFGLALLYMPHDPSRTVFIQGMTALSNISIRIIGWVMKTAPVAVAALIAPAVAAMGIDLMQKILDYIFVMFIGMLIHFGITYSLIVKFLIKIPLREFWKKMWPVFSTAFSTSSSSATMPVTMNTLEDRFKVPRGIVNFSVPIGTVVNMDGTALFEVVAAVFLAQFFGVHLNTGDHIFLLFIVFITSVGVASVPAASLPILMSAILVLKIPPEGMALIIGVDRLLDMSRTVVNVTGDSLAALFLSKTKPSQTNKARADESPPPDSSSS